VVYPQPNNVTLRVAPHEHVARSLHGLAARFGVEALDDQI
jgi:hypothetical protein